MLELGGLFPAQSVVVLVALILDAGHRVWLLLGVATFGKVLGSALNWAIGRFMVRSQFDIPAFDPVKVNNR